MNRCAMLVLLGIDCSACLLTCFGRRNSKRLLAFFFLCRSVLLLPFFFVNPHVCAKYTIRTYIAHSKIPYATSGSAEHRTMLQILELACFGTALVQAKHRKTFSMVKLLRHSASSKTYDLPVHAVYPPNQLVFACERCRRQASSLS